MRSLYWKIFAFFWLTLIITAGTVVTLTSTIIKDRQQLESHQIIEMGVHLADEYEEDGRHALDHELKALVFRYGIRAFMLDDRNRPISRVNLPKDWLSFTQPLTPQRFKDRVLRGLTAYRISSSSGTMYTLVAQVDRASSYRYWAPHLPALQLFTALIIVALFTAFVTWRITKPLVLLRKATNAFARGKFDARVDEQVICRKDEISQLGQSFNNMAERIAILLSNQQRLFRDISHELRTPLARQQIALELLARKLPESDRAGIDRIEREIGRMNELIDQVLTLLRLEQGEQAINKEEYDLGALITKLVNDATFEAQNEDKVNLNLPEQTKLNGCPELTARCLENIIRNALRYTGEDGQVNIDVNKGKEWLEISIKDNGPGVPEEALKHLFEPFYRVEDDRNQQSGGYGIGMAIAEQAIRSQGGTIVAANRPEGGLQITIRLPL